MISADRQFFQRFLIPLVNVTLGRTFVAHAEADYRLSVVELQEDRKRDWESDSCFKCLIGSYGFMLKKAHTAILLEDNEGGDALANDDAANALGSLVGLFDVRLPYVLWTPFGEKRMQGWPATDFKIVPLGSQRIPREMDTYATLGVDDSTFGRYWAEIFDMSEAGRRLRRALARHRHARVAMYREDAIMNAFIGLEALFLDPVKDIGKIPKRVGKRATRYILDPDSSPSLASLVGLSERIEELYKARHAIVHGADPTNLSTEEAAIDSMRLLASAICIALEEGLTRLSDLPGLAQRFEEDRQKAARAEKHAARHRRRAKRRTAD